MVSATRRLTEDEPLLASPRETPLPKLQMTVLCLVQLAEPIAYTQIFPYVNRMMESLHVTDDPRQIGFYSGLIESVFAFAQLLFIFQWGKLSGRKPVILCGLCGMAISTIFFGLSTSLPAALAARILAGALAGNVAVMQSMIGELTDETNQARAFPLLSLTWNLGCIIGPLLGGTLSEPATRYPTVFGRFPFFENYPFFLPCAVSCTLTLFSIILAYFALRETLHSKIDSMRTSDLASAPSYGSLPREGVEQVKSQFSISTLFWDPIVFSVTRTYFALCLTGTSIEVLFVLLAYTAIKLGGLSLDPVSIGSALAFGGFSAALMQPFAFPALTKRFRLAVLYPCFMALYPMMFLIMPLLNVIARRNLVQDTEDQLTPFGLTALWTSIAALLLTTRIAGMSYACNMIFLKHAAPSKQALGSTFGVGQTVAAVGRGIGPSLASSLFAATIEHNLLNGWFVWMVMSSIGWLAVVAAASVKDGVIERKKAADARAQDYDPVGFGA